ncbi:MAG: hypothetical protein ACYTEX_24815 [Planctomycetota bacterium]
MDGKVPSPRRGGAVFDDLPDMSDELTGNVRFFRLVKCGGIKAVVSELEEFEDFFAETGVVFVAIN